MKQMLRFLVVGIGSNIINYVIYLLVINWGFSLFIASIFGYLLGLYNSYYFGKTWVFASHKKMQSQRAIKFFMVYLVGGFGMALIIEVFTYYLNWDYRLAWFIGAFFAIANNFFGSKFFVFKREKVNVK